MYNKRILITGATGLLGSHVLRLFLARGYTQLVAMKRASSRMDLVSEVADQVEWIEGDILDIEVLDTAMNGVQWVVHCAAIVSYEKRLQEKVFEVNVTGTANVVNAALFHNVEKFVHISSIAVFTRTGGIQNINEKTEWEATPYTSNYGLTKHLAEMEVWRAQGEGLNVAMINPSIILGSGFWKQGSTELFYKGAQGLSIYPVGSNGFVDVRDMALLVILRLETNVVKGRMIANGENRSLMDVFNLIAKLMGKRTTTLTLHPFFAEIIWRILWPYEFITGREPVLSKATTRTTTCKLSYDNALSLTIPGFEYTPIEKTLEDIAARYKEASKNNFPALPMSFLPHHLS